MGTDITIFAERRGDDGKWQLFDEPVENTETFAWSHMKLIPNLFYDSRDYRLFSILANVRNGTKTEEPFNVVAKLRGVPDDMSQLGRDLHSEGCLSASWLYVEELFDFDWEQTAQFAGEVEHKYAYLFEGNPLGYPREEMRRLQNPNPKDGEVQLTVGPAASMVDGTKVRWRESYRLSTRDFPAKIERYRDKANPQSTRLVFWFDS